jgi:hypothetical protein
MESPGSSCCSSVKGAELTAEARVPPRQSGFNLFSFHQSPLRRASGNQAKMARGTFVLGIIEPGGLSTLQTPRGTIAVDSRPCAAPCKRLRRVTFGAAGPPAGTSSLAPPSPPCPRAAGTPTGRSPFSAFRADVKPYELIRYPLVHANSLDFPPRGIIEGYSVVWAGVKKGVRSISQARS